MLISFSSLAQWLTACLPEAATSNYRHRLFCEDPSVRPVAVEQLKDIVTTAHDDARDRLRRVFRGKSLDPLGQSLADPAADYPGALHSQTVMGYFGEVFAAIVAENMAPFGQHDWAVPAFLFRFHEIAFHELEYMRQLGNRDKVLFGRTGDDCLAFRRSLDGKVVASLFCESKCMQTYTEDSVEKAHQKLSDRLETPVNLPQVIEVLDERTDPDSAFA